MTVQSQNVSNSQENYDTTSNNILITTSSATGEFSTNGSSGWSAANSTNHGSGANTNFYYRDSSAGVHTVTAKLTTAESTPRILTTTQEVTINTPALPLASLTLEQRIAAASPGDTIDVIEDETVTGNIIINKPLTLTSSNESTISTSGSGNLFRTTVAGVTFSNLNFIKTDNVDQHIISVGGDDNNVTGNSFTGQYTLAVNAGTTRALEVSTVTGLVVSGNTINNLRQPAYINDSTVGLVSNNYVNETRGWVVVANSNITFTGNTWGSNAVDIALIPGIPNNYTCQLATIIAANNAANINDQVPAICPDTQKPTIVFNLPVLNSANQSSMDISVTATDNAKLQRVTASVRNASGTLVKSCSQLTGNVATHTLSCNTGALPAGTYTIRTNSLDDAGNISNTIQRQFLIDKTRPTVVFTNPVSTVSGMFSVSVLANDNDQVNKIAVNLRKNGVHHKACGQANNIGSSSYIFNCSLNTADWSSDTIYTVHTTATDRSGNNGSTYTPILFDNIAPAAPNLGMRISAGDVNSGDITNESTVEAYWNKPSEDTVKYEYQYWNNIEGNPYKENSPWQTDVNSESRIGDFTEGEGTHYIKVRAIDALGNKSEWSNIFAITYSAATIIPEEPGPVDPNPVYPGPDGEESGEGGSGSNPIINPTPLQPASSLVVSNPATTPIVTDAVFNPIFNTDFVGTANTPGGDVLGTATANNAEKTAQADVLGIDEENANILGLAWYWWLLILAATAGLVYYLVARRRKQED